MHKAPLSVTIITLNEEKNIERTLKSVEWAEEIIVIDSGSKDQTKSIAERFGAKVFENPWNGYGQQKNFAHKKASHNWVLNIDADEVITPKLKSEILEKISNPTNQIAGYYIPRKTFYSNQWIQNGGWYPNYLLRLAQKNNSRWSEPHLHEALIVDGPTDKLKEPLEHYTFQNIEDQVLRNIRYAKEGALERLRNNKKSTLFHILFKPIGKFIETYFIKRGFLDGFLGFIISINAAYSIFLKYVYSFENQNKNQNKQHNEK